MDEVSVVLATYKGLGSARLCGCNTIHLSIGPVTVAVEPEAFAKTATMIRDAMEQLHEIIEARKAELATSATPIPGNHQWKH